MGYEGVRLARPVVVDELVTVHYFEYSSSYYFEGERHDFWEFLYVDKGTVTVQADQRERDLCRGEMVFHQPGQFHALRANGVTAPNLVVVSFSCHSPAMSFFRDRILTVDGRGKALLGQIVAQAEQAFETPLDDPLTKRMTRRGSTPFGAEQLLGAALEELLVRFLRGDGMAADRPATPVRESAQQALVSRVRAYMEAHLGEKLTLDDLCRESLTGRGYLQRAFHAQTGGGAAEYFAALKIEAAKRMVRENGGNFSEIADALGYGSIHYFSRSFKKATGMTPTEYAASVKLLSSKSKIE